MKAFSSSQQSRILQKWLYIGNGALEPLTGSDICPVGYGHFRRSSTLFTWRLFRFVRAVQHLSSGANVRFVRDCQVSCHLSAVQTVEQFSTYASYGGYSPATVGGLCLESLGTHGRSRRDRRPQSICRLCDCPGTDPCVMRRRGNSLMWMDLLTARDYKPIKITNRWRGYRAFRGFKLQGPSHNKNCQSEKLTDRKV